MVVEVLSSEGLGLLALLSGAVGKEGGSGVTLNFARVLAKAELSPIQEQ
jgi:hypothetical protein